MPSCPILGCSFFDQAVKLVISHVTATVMDVSRVLNATSVDKRATSHVTATTQTLDSSRVVVEVAADSVVVLQVVEEDSSREVAVAVSGEIVAICSASRVAAMDICPGTARRDPSATTVSSDFSLPVFESRSMDLICSSS